MKCHISVWPLYLPTLKAKFILHDTNYLRKLSHYVIACLWLNVKGELGTLRSCKDSHSSPGMVINAGKIGGSACFWTARLEMNLVRLSPYLYVLPLTRNDITSNSFPFRIMAKLMCLVHWQSPEKKTIKSGRKDPILPTKLSGLLPGFLIWWKYYHRKQSEVCKCVFAYSLPACLRNLFRNVRPGSYSPYFTVV